MEAKGQKTKNLRDLRKGDILYMGIPFEENTADYYNGYSPKQIRGCEYKNKFGQSGKSRYVIVIGHDGNSIQYLPLTSRHKGFDKDHQYTLKDNSMTHKPEPDMKSYVEIDSLRSVYASPDWKIEYTGRVTENDMVNIMVQLGKRDIDFMSKRDQRGYVSRGKEESFENRLQENGYFLCKNDFDKKTYKNDDGRTVTKSKWGLVKYHVPLSKEEVTELVAVREGKSVTQFKKERDSVDDFARAVTDITEKSVEKESGVGQ